MITFEGNRNPKIFFGENWVHKIPAAIDPDEIRIKYKALTAEISGYEDQNEVSKNHNPGRRKKYDV